MLVQCSDTAATKPSSNLTATGLPKNTYKIAQRQPRVQLYIFCIYTISGRCSIIFDNAEGRFLTAKVIHKCQ